MRFIVSMDGGHAGHSERQDAEDVDDDSAEVQFFFKLEDAHVAFFQKMMKRKYCPVLAMQYEYVHSVLLAEHLPRVSRTVEEF